MRLSRSPACAWAQAQRRARRIDADVDTDTDTAADIARHGMHLPAASVHALVGAPLTRGSHALPYVQTSWREAIALVEQSEYHRFTTATKARAIKKPGGALPAA
jgi:hypothetical protein